MSNHFYWPGEEPPTPDVAAAEEPEHVQHLIIGPPGCGKTTWLSRQVQIAAKKYTGAGVVVASLTKAAAVEVAGRETGIPAENIGTLHAHCFRLLERPPIAETAKGIKSWNEKCGNSTWRLSNKAIADPENAAPEATASFEENGDELLHEAGILRHLLQPVDTWPPMLKAFQHRWQEWKDDSGFLDFTDLIERCYTDHDAFPGAPDVVLIDEAQDMSTLEIRLVRKLAAGAKKLIIVGDPDQALYTWRGADPGEVFGADVDDIQVLHQSYRVPLTVHARAVDFIERMPDRLPIAYEPRLKMNNGQPVRDADGNTIPEGGEVLERPYTWADPDPLIDAVRGDLSNGKTVMVIGSCRYMLQPLCSRLKDLGEPFWNPYRPNAGQWNPMRAANRLLAYLAPNVDVMGDDQHMWTWDEVRRWMEPLQARNNLARGAKSFVEGKGLRSHQLQTDVSQQTADLGTILGLLADDDVRARIMDMDVDWWFDNLLHRDRKTAQFPVAVYRRRGGQALRNQPKLIVGTIHSVKGGQADVVYLFPDLSGAGYWNGWKSTGEPHNAVYRLIYVGMTRAYEKLVLCQANGVEAVRW